MSLEDWLNEGKLQKHLTSREELDRLFGVFERDIKDARAANISVDRRFATAYNAALMVARAALAVTGYRTAGEGNHYLTIQSLTYTIKPNEKTVILFNKLRKKRNITDYEMTGMVSAQDVTETIELAQVLRRSFSDWLRTSRPDLAKD
jgi:hypothetical protein